MGKEQIERVVDSMEEADFLNHKSQSRNIICRIFGHKWNHKYKEEIFCTRCKRLWRFW